MGVATADSPAGPFTYAWDVQPSVNQGRVPGWSGNADLYLWYSARPAQPPRQQYKRVLEYLSRYGIR